MISKAGAGSRTEARRWIAEGRVTVDGKKTQSPDAWVDVEQQKITLDGRDAGRVDVRLDGKGRAQMLEVNPLAGLQPGYSDLPNMAEMAGMSYGALIGEIVRCASARIDGK